MWSKLCFFATLLASNVCVVFGLREINLIIDNNLQSETVYIRDVWMRTGRFNAKGSWAVLPGQVGSRSFYEAIEGQGVEGSLLLQIGEDENSRFCLAWSSANENVNDHLISTKWLDKSEPFKGHEALTFAKSGSEISIEESNPNISRKFVLSKISGFEKLNSYTAGIRVSYFSGQVGNNK